VLGRAYKKTRASVNVARIIVALISLVIVAWRAKKGRIRTRIQIVHPLESTAETQPQLQPSGAEPVCDDFPILHPVPGNRTHDYLVRFELRIRFREMQPPSFLRCD